MQIKTYSFHHPSAFWVGCLLITLGVLSHIPMFVHASHMGYHMAGMPMDMTMIIGMALIPVGLLFSCYGLMPRLDLLRQNNCTEAIHFHVADHSPLNWQHSKLVIALLVAVVVDVMKPATLGFVMPGMVAEYQISAETVGTLALVALTGTALGSILWGRMADKLGRRAAILLSALMFIGTSICGAMPSFEWNLAMCFLMGLSAGGLLPITFTLMAEMIPARHRGWLLVALGGLGTAAGYLVASGAAAILEPLFSWRILWMLGLPTGIAVIVLNRYIPESPRFLANAGLRKEARAILAQYNGQMDNNNQDAVPEKETQNNGFLHTIMSTYSNITIGLLGVGIVWGVVNFGFLLWLPTNLREMGMSAENTNSLLAQSGLFALPGIVLVIWLYHHWSSVKTLALFVALTAVSLMLYWLFELLGLFSSQSIIMATACLLVSSSGVIAMLIPYAAEIYPVHLRGSGTGMIAASSKFGGILGAILGIFGTFNNLSFAALLIAIPLLIFAFVLLKSGIDTRGRRLEDIQAEFINKSITPLK
ncbi:MFS transporter [uncultured Paraglaciecola sp.]|uniref:MFS transporter n=1 Tax=uncultured Paraglaciecola sp. TaxID=1765024 RepID=UPI0030DBCFD6